MLCYHQSPTRSAGTGRTITISVSGRFKNSSNSNRLAELASRMGVMSKLIDGPQDIDPTWLEGIETIGITAGASAPGSVGAISNFAFKTLGVTEVETLVGNEEDVVFEVPKELRIKEVK